MVRHPPDTGSDPARAALGWALHARGDDVAAEVLRQMEGHPSMEVMASIAAADRLATQIVGRWLATGEGATEAERTELAGPGSLINEIELPALIKAYLAWRSAAIVVVDEEAALLGCGEQLILEAHHVIARSSDASIVRMSRQFDSERRRLEDALAAERAKLAHQAMHDFLTGLPNRSLLYDRIAHALRAADRYGGTVALLFVDLDGFKDVNDGHGHETGDRLLQAVAERVRAAVRPSDTVARLGGDEFIVLCDRLDDPAEAMAVADRVLAALREPFEPPLSEAALTASIGIALGEPGDGPDVLVGRADQAMYVAKRRRDAHEVARPPDAAAPVVQSI
jgi:diguanylate cyclase (GGDEF)-like protein